MRVLITSFSFGLGDASGFATFKIVKALAEEGHEIVVLTSTGTSFDIKTVRVFSCNPRPLSPARFFKGLGNLVGREMNYIFWEHRAKREGARIIKSFKPQIIYGRGSPIAGLSVAKHLANKFHLPFMAHFADPIPAPEEWVSNRLERRKLILGIRPIIKSANMLSFVTREMMQYQQFVTKEYLEDKSIVCPNTVSVFERFTPPPVNREIIFLYLGSFYRKRNPTALFEGFSIFVNKYPNSMLHFYGANRDHLKKFLLADNVVQKVKFFPYSNDPFKVMESGHVLVDIDGDVKNPVFLSSKFLDYLSVKRHLISITTEGSPASKLIQQMPETSFAANHTAEEVAKTMELAASKIWNEEDFDERNPIIKRFLVTEVAKMLSGVFKNLTFNTNKEDGY